jgi:hypothetical protein
VAEAERCADLRIQFPVDSGRYSLVSDVMRDRYGINRVLRNVTTFAPGTYASGRWIDTEFRGSSAKLSGPDFQVVRVGQDA